MGSEAEVGKVLALRNDDLCTEARIDGLRSGTGTAEDPEFESPVESEDTDFGRSRTVGEGGSASLSSSSASDSKSNIFAKSNPTFGEFTKRFASSAGVGVASG